VRAKPPWSDTQKEVLAHALSEVKVTGHYLEFGAFSGGTIRYMAVLLKRAGQHDAHIHGFDSFEGLPEAWGGFNLGRSAFSVGGKLPPVPDTVTCTKVGLATRFRAGSTALPGRPPLPLSTATFILQPWKL